MEIILTVSVAITAFVATNLDDIFVLIVFFANKDFNKVTVVLGQYIGVSFIILICSSAFFFKFIIPTSYIALLGILPIIIGLKNLWKLKKNGSINLLNETNTIQNQDHKNYTNSEVSIYQTFKVASVTFANGGDNIGVYAPLFASMSIFPLILTIIIFMIMIGFWCIIGYLMVSNRILGCKLQKYGHIILPFVLIFIGLGILTRGL